ncbi:MAG: hypothetical protein PHF88_02900 [Candidatus Pacebacteria bacterium]|nr:hypothetical protein [Candidatus Paceibacterota bacterium]
MHFTDEDKYWFDRVKETPSEYQIIIDNDSVWVETDNINGETECIYDFSSYGYEFIYGLLNYLGINADMC